MNMDDYRKKTALLLCIVDGLAQKDTWGSETRIQKLVYFLQNLLDIPLDFEFILYMYSPYSYDLRDKLTSLRADRLLTLETKRYSGARFVTTDLGKKYQEAFPIFLESYKKKFELIINSLGTKPILELEQLAIAFHLTRLAEKQEEPNFLDDWAEELQKWRPNISVNNGQDFLEKSNFIRDSLSPDVNNPSVINA